MGRGKPSEGKLGRPRCPDTDRVILDVTRRQLAAVGYARMSVDAVAAEAGTTKPTIYRRWRSKEALAVAALADLQGEDAPRPTGDLEKDLVAVLRDFRKKLLRPNGMAMIGTVIAEEEHVPELIARFREQIVVPRRTALRAILRAGAERQELRADADLDAAVNMLVGAFYARYLADGAVPTDFPSSVVATVLRGIVR